jgi:hypothetical protein
MKSNGSSGLSHLQFALHEQVQGDSFRGVIPFLVLKHRLRIML